MLGLLTGVLYLHIASPGYTVSLTIAPVSQQPTSGSTLSGLSSLLGTSTSPSTDSFVLYREAIQAKLIAANSIANDQNLLHRIFSTEWSLEDNRWQEPPSFTHQASQTVRGILGLPVRPWSPPDAERVMNFLERMSVFEERTSPTVTLSITASSPGLGIAILQAANRGVDDFLKKRALDRSTESIAYIEKQLATVTALENRTILLAMLSEQEKTRMAASSGLPFAAEPFGAPILPPVPNSPNGLVVLVLSLLCGALAGFGLALTPSRALDSFERWLRALVGAKPAPARG